jgi:hypothetical protein
MKRLLVGTAALAAAVAVLVAVSLPPRRLALQSAGDGTIAGLLHVHTNRSDGRSTPDEVAAAAARAGLKFLVFTDHGDGTRQPDPPAYRSGVLCLDGVEISTTGGHYVAVDMRASPYPLGGEPRDVVEDVRRLGGFGIAAHPDSPKGELRWRDWDAQIDGVELVNPDTSWRVWAAEAGRDPRVASDVRWRARLRVALALLDYAFRSPETITSLMQGEGAGNAVDQWAALVSRRRVVAIAGIDAHAVLALRGDPAAGGFSLPLPGYEPSFRVMSVHAAMERPLTGDPQLDANTLVRAIRNGHLYVAIDGVAAPASFELTAMNAYGTVHQGDALAAGDPVTLRVRSNAPAAFTTVVRSPAGLVGAPHRESEFSVPLPPDPAVYWVEVRSTEREGGITWLRSNPVYVRGSEPAAPTTPPRPPATTTRSIFDGTSAGWRAENDALSAAAVDLATGLNGKELRFRYGLAGGAPIRPFAALVYDLPPGGFVGDRVTFTARAERPTRISVQLRGGEGVVDRWQRSVYLDTFDQPRTVYVDDCLPVGVTRTPRAPLRSVTSIMFVVELTNAKPGAMGRVWIRNAAMSGP